MGDTDEAFEQGKAESPLTSNCASNSVLSVLWSFCCRSCMAKRKSPALICVSPQVTDSRAASWVKMSRSCDWVEGIGSSCSNGEVGVVLT